HPGGRDLHAPQVRLGQVVFHGLSGADPGSGHDDRALARHRPRVASLKRIWLAFRARLELCNDNIVISDRVPEALMSPVRAVVPALLLASSVSADVPQSPAPENGDFEAFFTPLEVGPFSLTERSGKNVTRDDLVGKVWIVQFFYCTCEKGC